MTTKTRTHPALDDMDAATAPQAYPSHPRQQRPTDHLLDTESRLVRPSTQTCPYSQAMAPPDMAHPPDTPTLRTGVITMHTTRVAGVLDTNINSNRMVHRDRHSRIWDTGSRITGARGRGAQAMIIEVNDKGKGRQYGGCLP